MFSNAIKAGLAAALTASALAATPVLAAEETVTVAVRYSDLDLSTEQGQAALQHRLERAAEQVCGIDRRTSGPALPSPHSRRCYSEVVSNFDREVALRTAEQQLGG